MLRMEPKIIIGIITYKRPKMLKAALMSVKDLKSIKGVTVEVVVVDNDKMATAEDVVACCKVHLPYNVYYLIEENNGIPFARNKVIDKAIDLCASELVFFDDDEIVQCDWLVKLYNAYKRFGCEVVAGPVISIYPENTPKWALAGKFYERKRFVTGSHIPNAGTGNILFSMKCFAGTSLRFDEKLALCGGSDYCLTKGIVKEGGCIKWVDDAIVFEGVPKTRLNLKWIIQRNYRIHLNGIKYSLKNEGSLRTFFLSSLSFCKYSILSFLYAFIALTKSWYIVKSMICLTRCYAIVVALFLDVNYEEYKIIHGE